MFFTYHCTHIGGLKSTSYVSTKLSKGLDPDHAVYVFMTVQDSWGAMASASSSVVSTLRRDVDLLVLTLKILFSYLF